MKSGNPGPNHDNGLYNGPGSEAGGPHLVQQHNGGLSHPLSSANPPGLPRPPLHPAVSHNHGHSHLITGPVQHNGSPMQRLTHPGLKKSQG